MLSEELLRDEKRHIVSFVGGGGKTTLIYELAAACSRQGARVVVLTTTHMLLPERELYAKDYGELRASWARGGFGVIGTPEVGTGKLIAPSDELLEDALHGARLVLIEADGAKRLPCKLPAEHEPVLLPASDSVVAVVGMDALGRSVREACFRYELAWRDSGEDVIIDEELLARLLLSERGARKNVGARRFYIVLNKCDLVEESRVRRLRELLIVSGMRSEAIYVRGRKQKD